MFVIRLSEASVFRSILRGPDDFESTRFSCIAKYNCHSWQDDDTSVKRTLQDR